MIPNVISVNVMTIMDDPNTLEFQNEHIIFASGLSIALEAEIWLYFNSGSTMTSSEVATALVPRASWSPLLRVS